MSDIANPSTDEGERKYKMVISRTTVKNLGIKLYDKVSSVVAELIANAFDADAERVRIELPAYDKYLDSLAKDHSSGDDQVKIVVSDNGIGMTVEEVNEFYLKIGTNPREDSKRGELTKIKGRKRMGHKGIGKLAPFGICKKIEVITAGGNKEKRNGQTGFIISHFILDYDEINAPTDKPYYPKLGHLDGTISQNTGTTIILYSFFHKMIPDKETFQRQISRLFLPLTDFKIEIENRQDGSTTQVDEFQVEIEEDTKKIIDEVITVKDNGGLLPVKGWVARSKHPYKNSEMAGIRIYARGRLAAVTRDFGINAGFTGELTLRSYLVGFIVADWIDEEKDEINDLTNTGRQDIQWDSEKGRAFQEWGVKFLKKFSADISPTWSERTSNLFMQVTNFENRAKEKYGSYPEIEKTAISFAKLMSRSIDREIVEKPNEPNNSEYLNRLADFSLAMAPQRTVLEKLSKVLESGISTLDAMVSLFNDASMAEAEALGEVARSRIAAIDKLNELIQEGKDSEEKDLQKLIEESPWLIDPQWTMLQANQSFKNMKDNFKSYYKENKGIDIIVSAIESNKRADFIFLPLGKSIKIVEIKRKVHELDDKEFERIFEYYKIVEEFLNKNPGIKKDFEKPEILIICDGVNLSSDINKEAYDSLFRRNVLIRKSWYEISSETKIAHQDFLAARDPLKHLSTQESANASRSI